MNMTDSNNNNQSPDPTWFIDDNMPGTGNRPDWLPTKFKAVSELAKSYTELEKKVGIVPEDYDLSKSKYIDADYVPFQELKQLAKERRVAKDVMDKMVDSIDKYMDEFKVDYDEEFKKLGNNAKERLEVLNNWAKANLSNDSFNALTKSMHSADAVKAIEELRNKMMSNTPHIPNSNGQTPSTTSLQDIQQEIIENLEKYKSDAKYRQDLQARLEVAAKNAPGFIDKIGA